MLKKLKSRPLIILLAVLVLLVAGIGIVSANNSRQSADKDAKASVQTAMNTEKDNDEDTGSLTTETEEPAQTESAASETDKQDTTVIDNTNKDSTVTTEKPAATVEKKAAAATKTTTSVQTPAPAANTNTAPKSETVTPSRGGERTLTMLATAYEPGPISNGKWAGISHLGTPLGYGIVAVDPNVIPLGSRLYIEGYGEGYAADTGGAIKGNRIDLCYDTYDEAMAFGMKYVKVTILSTPK